MFELSRSGVLARSIAALTALAGSHALAAEEPGTVEEIQVTAERRSEAVQDVPLAISAFSGEFVRDRNLGDVKDLVLFTPGITGYSQDSFIDTLSVRGILTNDFGVGGDPSVSIFKNNVYQGRNGAVVTSLYDIDRAEVLRGPQGFLFGRNSIGGALSVFTVKPKIDSHDGYLDVEAGEDGLLQAEGAVTIPVSDHLAFRVAGYHSEEDGFVDNTFKPQQDKLIAHDKDAGRVSMLWSGDKTDVDAMIEYEDRNQSGSMYRATQKGDAWNALTEAFPELALAGGKRNVTEDMGLGEADDSQVLSLELQIDRDLGWATLSSISGYKSHDYHYAEDFDATPLRINDYKQVQSGDYFETELRLVSQGADALSWYGGVSLYQERINAHFTQGQDEEVWCTYYTGSTCSAYFADNGEVFTPTPEGMVEANRVNGTYRGWAAYVDFTYAFTDTIDASLGVRYTYDDKDFEMKTLPVASMLGPSWALGFSTIGYLSDDKAWDAFTPMAQVRYRPDNDLMLYASVTRGYKSGGFGSFTISPDQPFNAPLDPSPPVGRDEAKPDSFAPEHSWSYEVGTKMDLLDKRMRLDVATYYYTYEDLQVTVDGTGGGVIVQNVGKAQGWGVEGTLQWVLGEYVDVYLAGAWADSNVDHAAALCLSGDNACDGDPLPQLPEFSGSTVLELHHPFYKGEMAYTTEVYGQTKTYGGLEQLHEAVNDAYADVTLRVAYRDDGGWSVEGFCDNVTDEVHYDGVAQSGTPILPAHWFGPNRGRVYGLRMNWKFGK